MLNETLPHKTFRSLHFPLFPRPSLPSLDPLFAKQRPKGHRHQVSNVVPWLRVRKDLDTDSSSLLRSDFISNQPPILFSLMRTLQLSVMKTTCLPPCPNVCPAPHCLRLYALFFRSRITCRVCVVYLERLIITAVPARRVTQQTLRISVAGDRFPPNHRVVSAQVLRVPQRRPDSAGRGGPWAHRSRALGAALQTGAEVCAAGSWGGCWRAL